MEAANNKVASKQEVLDFLRRWKDKIANPKDWTRGAFARDEFGNNVPYASTSAVCWCLLGAKSAIVLEEELDVSIQAKNMLYEVLPIFGADSLSHLNDSFGHGAVMELFDKAIEVSQ